jgi:ssDNA-binding Zn-finger/Zn-ribbon topoisomerase 1
MTLKCSVFGHRFGDTEITREREERGSEVVTTITETETCERCGETRVVSENTEVTTLETPSDIVNGTADEAADEAADDGREAPARDEPAESEPAELIDEAESGGVPSAGEGPGTDEDMVDTPGPHGEDDAVILDETPDTDEADDQRAPGEWPDEADADETADEADAEWVPDTTGVTGTGTDGLPSVESEQSTLERTGQAATVPEGEFHCPECGFTTAVESSSLRAGDFCPECHRGALEHHPGE